LLRLKKHGQNGGKSGKNCNRQKVNLKCIEKQQQIRAENDAIFKFSVFMGICQKK
jgi:hypothetical protein